MAKIKYVFTNIESNLTNLNSLIQDLETLKSKINSLSINCIEVSSSLSSAKKSLNTTIDTIISTLENNIKIAKNACADHKSHEANINKYSFLNENFKNDELYTIVKGDNLSKIAKKYNTTVDAIIDLNKEKITNKDLIYMGDTIVIPGGGIDSSSTKSLTSNAIDNKSALNSLNNASPSKEVSKSTHTSVSSSSNVVSQTEIEDKKPYSRLYNNNIDNGFVITYDNEKYSLNNNEFDLLCAIVASECDKSADDALAVISTILNRCENETWAKSYGKDPLSQATAPNQYVVYQYGYYKEYMDGRAPETVKNAVRDALNGVRNCKYLSFRSNSTINYSSNMITNTGNRYK